MFQMQQKLLSICLISLISLIIFTSFENSFATTDPILITIAPTMENVIFDGKWTNHVEWKQSSYNTYRFDDTKIINLRTAHFGDYIYVFVDPINDFTLDEKMDETIICFDGKNNKSEIFDLDDFCFSVSLENNTGSVFQGNIKDQSIPFMQKISNPDDFISISTISDKNDPYSKKPHPSYEFKIPIRLLERSDNYGFFLSVYDASLDKFYSWPENNAQENFSDIPPPSSWGDIISPDKSLPELNFPILVLVIVIFTVILLQSKMKIGILKT